MRPQRSYFWYQVGEGEIERRDAGTSLAQIDAGLTCARFRDAAWLRDARPTWPPPLREKVARYVEEAAPPGAAEVPKKKAMDKDCTLVLGRPGIGDATPCFQ